MEWVGRRVKCKGNEFGKNVNQGTQNSQCLLLTRCQVWRRKGQARCWRQLWGNSDHFSQSPWSIHKLAKNFLTGRWGANNAVGERTLFRDQEVITAVSVQTLEECQWCAGTRNATQRNATQRSWTWWTLYCTLKCQGSPDGGIYSSFYLLGEIKHCRVWRRKRYIALKHWLDPDACCMNATDHMICELQDQCKNVLHIQSWTFSLWGDIPALLSV